MLVYLIYQSVGTLFFFLSFPFVLLICRLKGNSPHGIDQRYGLDFLQPPNKKAGLPRIWIHAASVGEVLAARLLIDKLILRDKKCEFFLSTMTKQGLSVACSRMPAEVFCFYAPLDVPVVVRRFLDRLRPDIYVCLETELWPAMFFELHKRGIPSVVLNGRMTLRSLRRYLRVRGMMDNLLGNLNGLAAISREDAERFRELGVRAEAVRITGNIKYDYPAEESEEVRQTYRTLLQVGENIVFICGSTRTGEEDILLRVYRKLEEKSKKNILLILAPRHLERLNDVQGIIARYGLEHDLFSTLKSSGRSRPVVLVDTMGELGQLYSAGDFNFVGGSLVNHRGHNIMEAARWGRPVYYGPSIDDFKDAAEILENEGGSFRVANGDDLTAVLTEHLRDKKVYDQACVKAAHAVSLQRGAAAKQADLLLNLLQGPAQ